VATGRPALDATAMTVDLERLAELLPGYDIGEVIGEGGCGIVIAARHRQLARPVAVKQLPQNFGTDPGVRRRFLSEARVLAGLDHPHIVPVFDFVEDEGLCLLVMEQLAGGTLWSRFSTVGLSWEDACAVLLATCSGLECAHRRGVLHRDIKPENLLFSSTGAAKITDFGIAKVVGGEETMATQAGLVLGTVAYMSPEQARGGELGPGTDVYAGGTMLYELLSGRLPFSEEGDVFSVLFRHCVEQPAPLHEVAPNVPAVIADVVMRAIASQPEDRFPTAEAFGVALAEAATAVWGEGWLGARSDVMVTGSAPIQAAAERVSTARGATASRHRVTEAVAPDMGAVRPVSPVHEQRRAAAGAGPADVVPVRRILERRARALPAMLAALALVVAAVAVAFLAVRVPAASGGIPSGTLSVAGAPLPASGSVPLDLTNPVSVAVSSVSAAAGADTVRLAFSVAQIPLGSVSAPLEPAEGGRLQASLDAAQERYLVPSGATGTLALLHGGSSVGGAGFTVTTGQSPWLTAPALAAVLLLLFCVAYLESLLRSLRRGQRRLAALPSLFLTGLVGGVALPLLAWIVRGRPPTVAILAVCAVLGGASAVAAGVGTIRLGRWRSVARRRSA